MYFAIEVHQESQKQITILDLLRKWRMEHVADPKMSYGKITDKGI
jgi:hypothetical protein